MNFLSKESIIDAASLGGGVIAAKAVKKVVNDKFGDKLPATMDPETKKLVLNVLPIVGGIATLVVGKGNRIANGVANGMFAEAFAGIVDFGLQKIGVTKEPFITGTDDVFMGEVLMNGTGESVLMGAAQDMPSYSSDSYDFTAADAGELNY
jgi:hypothetical protein